MPRLPALFCLLFALTAGPLAAAPVQLSHSGLKLNAELIQTADDWSRGSVVLMTHGTLAHNGMEIIKSLQAMLRDRGISSLAVNLSLGLDDRTSAMYDCPTPHVHKHVDAVEEIGVWLDWLKARGAGKIALLGHSRGGNQTAWFAAEHADPVVSKIFLVAPGGWGAGHEAEDYQKRYGKPLAPILQRAQERVQAGTPKQLIQPIDFIYCKDTAATAEAVLGYYDPAQLRDTADLLPKIAAPVVVFAGSEDKVVAGLIEHMESLTDDPRVSLQIIDGADHFFRDLYAEDIADRIAEEMAD